MTVYLLEVYFPFKLFVRQDLVVITLTAHKIDMLFRPTLWFC